MTRHLLNRRTFLRGAGVSLSLPLLDAMLPRGIHSLAPAAKRRLVAINVAFGLHSPFFYPEKTGLDHGSSPYLRALGAFERQLTVFSGVSHPGVDGGHFSEASFLTGARHPASSGFRNTISLDQVAAEKIGGATRYSYLALSTGKGSQSYSRSGVEIPAATSPAGVFARLFLTGKADEVELQIRRLRDGQSIMDTVLDEARQLQQVVGPADRSKLDGYFTSVRATEKALAKAEQWAHKPKPTVDAEPPQDIGNPANIIGRARLMYDLIHLALQTDSTRVMTLKAAGTSLRPPLKGVKLDYHNLSHHGQVGEKIAQLRRIEVEQMRAIGGLLAKLAATEEPGGSLLDQTMVLFGSNLGNGNNHDTKNMPMVLAGGGFAHGQHLAFDRDANEPVANLYLSMLHRLGLEVDSFASSTGPIAGLEMV